MEKSSLVIDRGRILGKVIHPATYQFSKQESLLFNINLVRQHETVVLRDVSRPPVKQPEVKGLSTVFANLKSIDDIDRFAGEYGLLGLSDPHYSINSPPKYGEAYFEPLPLWLYHIKNVRRLMLLYRSLTQRKKGHDVEIEGKLLQRKEVFDFVWVDESLIYKQVTAIQWYDSDETVVHIDGNSDEDETAFAVLSFNLKNYLAGGINLDFSKIISAKDAVIGFRITETRYTPYMLAAIYYDLWELITNNRQVINCRHCGLPIEKTGRRDFCNNACKQAWHRKQKKKNGGSN